MLGIPTQTILVRAIYTDSRDKFQLEDKKLEEGQGLCDLPAFNNVILCFVFVRNIS